MFLNTFRYQLFIKGILYHKSNLVNVGVFPQFLIKKKNSSAET